MKAQRHTLPRGEPAEVKEAVAYADLLQLAHDEGLKSIQTQILAQPHDENGNRCIMKAVVETEKGRFEGIGDADPDNVENFLAPHLIRVAETRAKARALRDAVNCGVVSFEELDGVRQRPTSSPESGGAGRSPRHAGQRPARPRGNGQARTRSGSSDPMSDAQRRYLFRLLAGQGYQGEAAEERLHELFEVDALSQITKRAATQMIDRLLQDSDPDRGGGGNGAATRPQR